MSTARVIITDQGLPSGGVGSWTQRVEYLLQGYAHNNVDYLICEKNDEIFNASNTKRISCHQCKGKFLNKIIRGYRYKNYFNAVNEICEAHSLVVVCIIDSIRV